MLPHSWLPLCTSFSCFQGGNKHDSTVVSWSTDPWDSNYLTDRGYSLWTEDDEWKVFSHRFHYPNKYPVVQLSIDTDYQGVSICDDNLRDETPSGVNLEIQNIFAALSSRAGIDPNRMQWISINDAWATDTVRDYRQDHDLGPDDFYITPEQADWETFSNSHYFQAVSKMMPGVEIGRIDVRRQQIEVWHHGYPPIDVECMTFWFKQPVSEDDDASMDPIAKNLKFYNEERSFYHRIVPCKTTCF
ncbi:hypothetical protein CFIMG_005054RAa [Ceratocystis fimbriata CBS 114723]|uniref:Uncharacterized protein n=1 Tax=Ceratocystis fimbriata CBS 114723 TaxID=1035309 RepID=A0A2C5WXN7_9PEZI|nr:hypothetical protein CFIMG_005054RAa [Ceratocystis fimbriata CBS 114723]